MNVPFADLSREYEKLKTDLQSAFDRVMRSGQFILGKEVHLFEKEFARYCGSRYAVSLNSGTDALYFSLLAIGIGKGDEVILPANSFISCAYAISYAGAVPVFVDIDPASYCIDIHTAQRAITRRTKAIMPVHMFGHPADMDAVLSLAKNYRLFVIEDSSQAHGARYKNKKVGSIGDIGVFSLYPTKNLGVYGDGGVVVTDTKEYSDKIRSLRSYGESKKYYYREQGYNSRLDELQAAFARVKLKRLDAWNKKRIKAAQYYSSLLKNVSVISPSISPDVRHVYYVYVIRTKKRGQLQLYLKKKGIDTAIHYPVPIHKQKAYQSMKQNVADAAITEKYSREILSLPLSPWITEQEIECVSENITKFLNK